MRKAGAREECEKARRARRRGGDLWNGSRELISRVRTDCGEATNVRALELRSNGGSGD